MVRPSFDGEEHYACPKCHDKFKLETYLVWHLETGNCITGNGLCPFCSFVFDTEVEVEIHVRKMHKNEVLKNKPELLSDYPFSPPSPPPYCKLSEED